MPFYFKNSSFYSIIIKEKKIKVNNMKTLEKGIFISFEGNDGSGKSTTVRGVYDELVKRGYDVIVTREPGGSKIAEKIRSLILDNDNAGMDARTESLLYASSRREHVVKVIKPALEAKKIVLCDRYIDSSLAYQGYARGIGIDEVYEMNMYATEGLLPELTVFVVANPEVGFMRIRKNARELDRLEQESLKFHKDVYDGYCKLIEKFPERIKKVNGEQELEVAVKEAVDLVVGFVEGR